MNEKRTTEVPSLQKIKIHKDKAQTCEDLTFDKDTNTNTQTQRHKHKETKTKSQRQNMCDKLTLDVSRNALLLSILLLMSCHVMSCHVTSWVMTGRSVRQKHIFYLFSVLDKLLSIHWQDSQTYKHSTNWTKIILQRAVGDWGKGGQVVGEEVCGLPAP